MKAILILGALLATALIVSNIKANNQNTRELMFLFKAWKQQHQKFYNGEEDNYRFSVFVRNFEIVEAFNAESDNSGKEDPTYLSLNKFADLTNEEFKATYTGKKRGFSSLNPTKMDTSNLGDIPDTIDWRDKGAVQAVKDQGQCGSCWAFSAIGGLEGIYEISSGKLESFSEQQIVDCSHNGGNSGCDGGDLPPAFDYVVKNGIERESDYPYTARDGKCKFDASKVVFKPSGYTEVPENDGKAIAAAAAVQPLSVCIEADSSVFQFYTKGVIDSKRCGTDLDHCVTLVGYNLTASTPYWIVKNSWGKSWGNKGYVLIKYDESGPGICGINEEAVAPKA